MNLGWLYENQSTGFYGACSLHKHVVAFSALFNGLESLKTFEVKLHKHNQNLFQGYYMNETLSQI